MGARAMLPAQRWGRRAKRVIIGLPPSVAGCVTFEDGTQGD